jgi:hypothetical protein
MVQAPARPRRSGLRGARLAWGALRLATGGLGAFANANGHSRRKNFAAGGLA